MNFFVENLQCYVAVTEEYEYIDYKFGTRYQEIDGANHKYIA